MKAHKPAWGLGFTAQLVQRPPRRASSSQHLIHPILPFFLPPFFHTSHSLFLLSPTIFLHSFLHTVTHHLPSSPTSQNLFFTPISDRQKNSVKPL